MEMEKEEIVAVKKDNQDRLVEFKTNNGKIYNYETAKEAIEIGLITNAELFKGRDSQMHIKGRGDGDPNNNLANLPEF